MKRLGLLLLLIPSIAFAGPKGETYFASATPTVDTSVYASGDVIGGKLQFDFSVRQATGTGYVISAKIDDKAATTADLDLILFRKNPTGSTITDQLPFTPVDADLDKIIGIISFGSTSRFAFADNGVKYVGSLVIPIEGRTSTGLAQETIYGVLVSRGTPTFASSSDVKVTLGIAQD